ncbi:Retrovirus-related Pol polyprotein from transposon TNT 1-94 [Vitis vinifera]|uniref:Retrovirus-related Pol polyprotein from transposon TNT 1-94 n=1 Tax=Vitis vinifera TaxID=29760 RepID=A0A438EN13_VITVI|nr:Retrovirus-related Pol polyprotein from transposon TNT 1-94 [Vitis vinifera]
MKALEKHGTWQIMELPRGNTPIGCKWILFKCKANGTIERYKAKLVAKGYIQPYDIDYQETFAPVAKINTVRDLPSLIADLDWSLHHLDIKNAFLNRELEEEVYMQLPPSFENPYGKGNVYDIILIKNDEAEIGQLKTLLSKEFEIKGMGPLRYFLEIEIA